MSRNVVLTLTLCLFLALAVAVGARPAQAGGNPNPGVIPNTGHKYGDLHAQWWQWILSIPYAEDPAAQGSGPVDLSAHQSGKLWFLAGEYGGIGPVVRSGEIPAGTQLFMPMANYIDDYPCPPEWGFEPAPGETLEQFLVRDSHFVWDNNFGHDLTAEIDGAPVQGLHTNYFAISSLFTFTAESSHLGKGDACLTGTSQPGVASGYALLLTPFTPGHHTIHFAAPSWGQDVTYDLTVKP
jgi:hypothetical protein